MKLDWYSEPGQPYQTLRVNKKTGYTYLLTYLLTYLGTYLGTYLLWWIVKEVKLDWYSEPGQPYQTLRVNKKTGQLDITATIPKSSGFLGIKRIIGPGVHFAFS